MLSGVRAEDPMGFSGFGGLAARMPRPLLFYVPTCAVVVFALVGTALMDDGAPAERFTGPAIGLFDLVAFVLAMSVRRRTELDAGTWRACSWFAAGSAVGVASVAGFI